MRWENRRKAANKRRGMRQREQWAGGKKLCEAWLKGWEAEQWVAQNSEQWSWQHEKQQNQYQVRSTHQLSLNAALLPIKTSKTLNSECQLLQGEKKQPADLTVASSEENEGKYYWYSYALRTQYRLRFLLLIKVCLLAIRFTFHSCLISFIAECTFHCNLYPV